MIAYDIRISNVGNIDLVNLAVIDPLIDESSNNLVCFPVARGGTLTVAQPNTRCTGTYTVPQSAINAGQDIVNVVRVSSASTQPVTASFNTRVIRNPLMTVTKKADRPSVSNEQDVILYTIELVKKKGKKNSFLFTFFATRRMLETLTSLAFRFWIL